MSSLTIPTRSCRPAFALIVSLTLLSFLLMLMLSLSSMVLVSSKAASAAKQTVLARQNARYALDMAIMQLQKYAGPDQRVTAMGSIMDLDLSDEDDDTPHKDINAPYFTGVWSTDPIHLAKLGYISNPVDPHTNPAAIKNAEPIAWLTSDPRGMFDRDNKHATKTKVANFARDFAFRETAPWMPEKGDRRVPLLIVNHEEYDRNLLTSTDSRNILLNPVKIEQVVNGKKREIGSYAWWTGGQAVKASIKPAIDWVNWKEPQGSDILNLDNFKATTPTHAAIDLMTIAPGKTKKINDRIMDAPKFEENRHNILTLEQAGILFDQDAYDKTDMITRQRFHDLTANSMNVLSSVMNGGLKRDLTAAFMFDNEFEKLIGSGGHTENRLTQYAKNLNMPQYAARVRGGSKRQVYPPPFVQSSFSNAGNPPFDVKSDGYDWHNPGGPTWELLRSYFQLADKKKFKMDNAKTAELTTLPGAQAAVLSAPIPGNSNTSGIYPVVLNLHHHAWMVPVLKGSNSGPDAPRTYIPRLLMTPVVVLWNPFNVKLEAKDYYLAIYGKLDANSADFNSEDVEFINSPKPYIEWGTKDPNEPKIRKNGKLQKFRGKQVYGGLTADKLQIAYYNDGPNPKPLGKGGIDGSIPTWPGMENGFRYILRSWASFLSVL